MKNATTFVTRPSLPPLEEFLPSLEKIWDNRILTNGGPFHKELEQKLCEHLGVQHICLFANGTIALQTALQALRITGEVITTPYSFVATSHSLLWNGIQPVFVDVDPHNLNLDPSRIEAAITQHTTAIVPVHCYGHPCKTDAIQRIADDYNLKVIYDAAHAFGVKDVNGSVLNYGDLSVLSFHATKVFNTFEGGAIICPDAKTKARVDNLKNFGHSGEISVVASGTNGKMSEFNAALGVLQLKYIDLMIEARQRVDSAYRERLEGVKGIRCLYPSTQTTSNYSYFPILIGEDFPISRDAVYDLLKEHGVHARRYFYPLISSFAMYRSLPSSQESNLPVATRAATQVLCLPIFPDLEMEIVDKICDFLISLSQTEATAA